MAGPPPSWSAEQLAEFLAAVSAPQHSRAAGLLAVERAAESLDAEVAALVGDEGVAASVGFPAGRAPEAELISAADGGENLVTLPGLGRCSVAIAGVSETERLLVARAGADGFAREEVQLLRGMARVLSLTSASLRLLERERRAQGRVAASERQTRQILETAHDAFVAIDGDGVITDWNPQAEATFGWTREEALGRELAQTIIPEDYREAHRRGLGRFMATGEGSMLGKRLELVALHREGHQFPVELTISVLEAEAGYSFNAFLRDVSERKHHERYLEAQHATAVVLAESDRVSDAVPRLLEAIGGSMGWEFGTYWEWAGGRLCCEMTWMAPGAELVAFDKASRQIYLEPGAGLPGRVFQRARPEFVKDVRMDTNFLRAPAAKELGLGAAVAIPLSVRGEVRGVVEFISRGARHREPELVETMETLTGLIGRFFSIVSEREELREKLERLALTDELTGLSNRRGWDQGFEREVARAERSGETLCVALLDLDNFKHYNDECGHPAGDDLLRETTAAWSSCLRSTDLLARLGGDEFALAFPAQPPDVALAVVERLRAVTPAPLTCSAGLAPWRRGKTAQQLISRADTALYEAKRTGRDKTLVAGDFAAISSDAA